MSPKKGGDTAKEEEKPRRLRQKPAMRKLPKEIDRRRGGENEQNPVKLKRRRNAEEESLAKIRDTAAPAMLKEKDQKKTNRRAGSQEHSNTSQEEKRKVFPAL